MVHPNKTPERVEGRAGIGRNLPGSSLRGTIAERHPIAKSQASLPSEARWRGARTIPEGKKATEWAAAFDNQTRPWPGSLAGSPPQAANHVEDTL